MWSLRILLRRQLAPGEDDDRHLGKFRPLLYGFEKLETRHIGQAQVQDDAVDRFAAKLGKRFGSRTGNRHLDVFVAQQLHDAELLGLVVLDDEQALLAGLGIGLDACELRLEMLLGRRLGHEGERAARQSMLTVLIERNDLNGNMTRQRILLQLAKHAPAQHVGKEDIERDGGRLILLGKLDGVGSARCKQHLEPGISRDVHDDARVMAIVFDDEQDRFPGRDVEPVVGYDLLEGCPVAS